MNSEIASSVQLALNKAAMFAGKYHTQYITPEIFLQGLLTLERFRSVLEGFATSLAEAGKDLAGYIAAFNVSRGAGQFLGAFGSGALFGLLTHRFGLGEIAAFRWIFAAWLPLLALIALTARRTFPRSGRLKNP